MRLRYGLFDGGVECVAEFDQHAPFEFRLCVFEPLGVLRRAPELQFPDGDECAGLELGLHHAFVRRFERLRVEPDAVAVFPGWGGPALYGEHYSMGISGGNYVLTDYDTGTVYAFDVASGLLLSVTTAGGQVTTNTIVAVSGGYQISQTSRSFTYTQCGSSLTTTETLLYTYYPIDGSPTSGLLQYVTLARTDASTRRSAGWR